MRPSSSALAAAALLSCIHLAAAIQWIEPVATPIGEWAGVMGLGFSPKPTQVPEMGGIPRELRRRQSSIIPDNWCGFVNGDINDVLSCDPQYTCVYSDTAVGCCGAGLIATCTDLFTSCVNFNDPCGAACNLNNKILKCTAEIEPYCATFTFASGKINYNCATEMGTLSSVAFISDVLATASFSASAQGGPLTIPTAVSSYTIPTSRTSTKTSSSVSAAAAATSKTSSSKSSGISVGVIVGIVVGAIAIIGAVAGGLLLLCLRRNKKNPSPAAAAAQPVMQQAPQQPQSQYTTGPQGGQYAAVPQSYPVPQQPQQGPYYAPGQQQPGPTTSYYDPKVADVPPQYQPPPPTQDYSAYNATAQPRDSIMKPVVPEISGTELAGGQQGPSRVTSPVSVIGGGQAVGPPVVAGGQGYEVGSTSGPVYEMPEGVRR